MTKNTSKKGKKPFSFLKKLGATFFSPLTSFIIMLAFVGQYFFDWWVIALAAFTGCYLQAKSGGEAFRKSFAGIGVLWLFITLYYHLATDGILSTKIASILPLNGNANLLVVITVLVGGLVGGSAGVSGYLVRDSIKKYENKQ
jgi:hypothetical protein